MREFANHKALQDYVESNDLVYLWEEGRAFAMRFNQLSPEQRELVNVKTKRGVTRALLFSKAILRSEFAADARCARPWRSSANGCRPCGRRGRQRKRTTPATGSAAR
jgi:hypothetical protein